MNIIFVPWCYVIYERAKFFRRVQMEGETVEQFIYVLSEAADWCEFPDRSTQILIVVSVRNQNVSREMQKMEVDHLTEAKAVCIKLIAKCMNSMYTPPRGCCEDRWSPRESDCPDLHSVCKRVYVVW